MTWVRRIAALALATAGCSRPEPPRPEGPPTLVGTWRVVRHVRPAGTDTTRPLPFGAHPDGYLVYGTTGHVFMQVLDRDWADSLRVRTWPDSVLRRAAEAFRAYFGTYTVDSTARMVTHRIEGEFLPRAGRVEVATPYRILGDSLFLGRDSLEHWVFIRVR